MKALFEFISIQTGAPLKKIIPNASLADDLKIAGADGEELIQNFGKYFNVDVSNFNSVKYFGLEASGDLAALFFKSKRQLKPLFVKDLQCAIEAGILT